MEGTYDVSLGREVIGKVRVWKRGLYSYFSCRCKLSGQVMYKLLAVYEDRQENLGLLVPMGDAFGLEKKVSLKRLGSGTVHFRVVPKQNSYQGKFVPICPEEPFAYIARLKNAFLEKRGEQIGVVLNE